jgi:glutathione peroxidase-family protein
MKYLVAFSLLLFSICVSGQGLMDLSVKKLQGDSLQLDAYGGKKLLFVVIPHNADSSFEQVKQFALRYKDTVVVFGIPSREDGYQDAMKSSILSLYGNLPIVVLEAQFTRKTSTGQSNLMSWLTTRTKNRHFDTDASGIGSKFFVDQTARLYAVFPPRVSLQSPLINKVVQVNPPPFPQQNAASQ